MNKLLKYIFLKSGILTFALLFTSCDQYKPIMDYLKQGQDTIYIVIYSDNVDFTSVFYIDTVYQKSRDHYSLPVSKIDSRLMTQRKPNKPFSDKDEYYARVLGLGSDNVFYTSPVHHWVNRETTLDEIRRSGNEHRKKVTLETPEGNIEVPVDSLKK
jgi:hypothetical protein